VKPLQKGYTTGVHTSWAFKHSLEALSYCNGLVVVKTNKMDNDDLDVTKGCQIVVSISFNKSDLVINPINHKPYILKSKYNKLEIYAGIGVGIVTKCGLKAPQNYPAINPIPLQSLEDMFQVYTRVVSKTIYCTIGITNGELIAKQTANKKVGIVGGLSILGTTGWVKPISATAYIHSIQAEINFIATNCIFPIVLTIGNNSYKYGVKKYSKENIVQIGNFVYDSLQLCNKSNIKNIVLICGIGKLVKIAQKFKNTHNRFGSIDFVQLKQDIQDKLHYDIDIDTTYTVKGILNELTTVGLDNEFIDIIKSQAILVCKEWFSEATYSVWVEI